MPGPGQYKISGFTDVLLKKMEHQNLLKEKSIELKKSGQKLEKNYSLEKSNNFGYTEENLIDNQIENQEN